jgi:hypothetical protein
MTDYEKLLAEIAGPERDHESSVRRGDCLCSYPGARCRDKRRIDFVRAGVKVAEALGSVLKLVDEYAIEEEHPRVIGQARSALAEFAALAGRTP